MPMPHRTFAQLAKRRLVGKEGRDRVREVNALLAELPDYKNGPYADLRKWLASEIEESPCPVECCPPRLDRGPPRRGGADRPGRAAERRQVVRPPGAVRDPDQDRRLPVHDASADPGADADRWRPRPARRDPGADRGANEDRGGGRALLGVLRSADAIVYCARAGGDPAELRAVRAEMELAGIDKPAFLAATRADEAPAGAIQALVAAFPDLDVVPVSVIDEASLQAFREAVVAPDRPDPGSPADGRRDGSRAACARSRRDGRGRGRLDPPRSRRAVRRGACLGAIRTLRRPTGRPRPPRVRWRFGRDPRIADARLTCRADPRTALGQRDAPARKQPG